MHTTSLQRGLCTQIQFARGPSVERENCVESILIAERENKQVIVLELCLLTVEFNVKLFQQIIRCISI